MEYSELDIKAYKFWTELSVEDRIKILSENQFWDGFSVYKYEYIPEDLQAILRRKIESNDLTGS
jgi:hypothetical protein